MLGHAEFRHHVELPNDIGFVFVVVRLLFEWAVVFPVMESFGVEANNFASAGDVPQTVSVDERGSANALIRPIVDSTGGEFFAAVLPKEFSIGIIETKEHAQVDGCRVTLDVSGTIIRTDIDLAVGNDWVSVSLRTEGHRPADVLAGFHVEGGRQRTAIGNIVSLDRTSPLGPILGFDLQLCDALGCNRSGIVFVLC